MAGIEQAANDLFFKLRNRFPNINLGDEQGNSTNNPADVKFFNFDFEVDGIKFGNITASLIDSQKLKVYYSLDVTKYMDREEKNAWYSFLQEIRKFAKAHLLGLDVRDINKDILTHEDLKFVTSQNKEKSQIGESKVLWARRGKVSEGNLNNVKIHVVHSERMEENTNNRLLRVDRIFLVNESGEKFLLPFKSVMAAKAMANHVSHGGTPYDQSGKLISTAVNEMNNLRRFATATRRKTFESEDAVQVIEAAAAIKESIKRSLFRLANNSRFNENMEDLGKILAEQDDIDDIKPMFIQQVYNENLDNWINSAAKAYKQYKGNIMEALKESAGAVASKLKDPNWKMILKDDPSEDRLIASSKYVDGKALLRRVLGTVADRIGMNDSDIANWASQIGQDIEEGKASREDMQIALQLAKRYQDDLKKIMSSPESKKELRVSAFGQKKNLYGKVKGGEEEEFESYVNGIGEGEESEMMDEISADEEGMGQMKVNEVEVAETPMDRIRERASSREVTTTPAERVAERVTSRTGGTTATDRVADRVSARHPMTKVAERVAARAGQGEEVVSEVGDDEGLPNKSEWEYDKEGDMAKDEIHTIVRHAEELEKALGDDENLPEWIQEKLAQIKGMMTGVSDYMLTQHERGEEKRSGEEGIHEATDPRDSRPETYRPNNTGYAWDRLSTRSPSDDEDSKATRRGKQMGLKHSIRDALGKHGPKGKLPEDADPVEEGIEVNPINDSLALMKKLAGL